MKSPFCLILLLSMTFGLQAQEKSEKLRLGYGELSLIMPASEPSYFVRTAFQLGFGKQIAPGLDMGAGLEMNARNNLAIVPYLQLRGSSHPTQAYGLYYSLSGGIGNIYHEKGAPPGFEQPESGNYWFAQFMAGSRIKHYGLLAVGLRYSSVQLHPDYHVFKGLHFSGQLGIMLEGKDRSNPQNFDEGIRSLYFYALTGLWRSRRTDLSMALWDNSLAFGYGFNFLPYLGIGFSASFMKGIDMPYFSNQLSLVGMGIHVNGKWKNWVLMVESGPILSASVGFYAEFESEIFRKSPGFKPYVKIGLGPRLGKRKRLFLHLNYTMTPELDGVLEITEYHPREINEEYRSAISISRFQLSAGVFLSSQ